MRFAAAPPASVVGLLAILTLLTAAVLGGLYFPAQRFLDVAATGVLLVGVLLVSVRSIASPLMGFAALLVTGVLAPIAIRAEFNITLLLAAAIVAAWVIRPILLRRPLGLKPTPIVLSALVFAAVAVLAFIVGQYPWFPTEPAPMRAQLGGLALFVVSVGLCLSVGSQMRSLGELERLTWLFITAGGAFVVMEFAGGLPGLSLLASLSEPAGAGSMFWVWLVALSFGQGLCNTQLSFPFRLIALSVGTLALARGFLLAFSWASGWLPPAIALAVLLFLRFPRTALAGGLVAVVPVAYVSSLVLNAVMEQESYSWMTRLEAWGVMLEVIEKNPLLGYGPANYYHYTLLFPILGWWVKFNSHNNYIDILGQTGVLGLLAFFWFAAEASRLALRLWSRAPQGFARAYAAAALAGVLASVAAGMLADWIVPFAYNIGLKGFRSSLLFWFFIGGSIALARMTASAGDTAVSHRSFATSPGLQPVGGRP